jgi:hypothetical protein
VSRAYLVLLLQLYQTTPTKRSFDESQLEKDIIQFLDAYQIGCNEVPYPAMVDDALQDDVTADGGWSIFAHTTRQYKDDYLNANGAMDDLQSRCSSNSSVISEQCVGELDLDYF